MTATEPIYFLTGNAFKVREITALIPSVQQLKIDLPEIQELDPRRIIEAKVEAAFDHHQGPFIVEDTSLTMDGMNGLPGPFVKWFEEVLDHDHMVKLSRAMGNGSVTATTIIGYAKARDDISYFEGSLTGVFVPKRGLDAFGWDPIFQPDGHTQTLAEMGQEKKLEVSYRGMAVRKLVEALHA